VALKGGHLAFVRIRSFGRVGTSWTLEPPGENVGFCDCDAIVREMGDGGIPIGLRMAALRSNCRYE
jgi:hypothetical protein